MSDNALEGPVPIGGRVKLGAAVFVLSILLPVIGIPVVSSLGLSTGVSASVSGVLLVAAEVMGVAAIAIMGKPGYNAIKSRVFGFLKKHGPPRKVSRARYRIGLVMFALPLLFGWLYPYATKLVSDLPSNPLAGAVIGDIVLLTSLFVLGGDFWDKIRALFFHDATARFPQSASHS